jgi:hypothetical protein
MQTEAAADEADEQFRDASCSVSGRKKSMQRRVVRPFAERSQRGGELRSATSAA